MIERKINPTFYPGDIVRYDTGKATYVVSEHGIPDLPGEIVIESTNTGFPRSVYERRLVLVERGAQGIAADAEAQRQADDIAERARLARRAAAESCQRRSGTGPTRFRLGAARPAFGQQDQAPAAAEPAAD